MDKHEAQERLVERRRELGLPADGGAQDRLWDRRLSSLRDGGVVRECPDFADDYMRREWAAVIAEIGERQESAAKERAKRERREKADREREQAESEARKCVDCGAGHARPRGQERILLCDEHHATREAAERRAAAAARRIAHLSIPPRFATCTLDGYGCPPGDPRALGLIRGWVERGGEESILLGGVPGAGKTHLAIGAARLRVVAEGIDDGAYVRVPELLWGLRAIIGAGGDVDAKVRQYVDAGVLVLDDLGAQRVTDFAAETVDYLIDQRWSYSRPTIITTNTPPVRMAEELGARTASRLAGMCGRWTVHVDAEDYRRPTP